MRRVNELLYSGDAAGHRYREEMPHGITIYGRCGGPVTEARYRVNPLDVDDHLGSGPMIHSILDDQ